MSDLHPDHVTPVLALEDQDACSPLVLRSAGLQAAKIIRKLTNDLGYREQEITRLRADLAAAQERERDEWRAEAERTAAEARDCFEAQSEIDEAWNAIGTRGNRETLTLSEQVASLCRELDDGSFYKEADIDRLMAERDAAQEREQRMREALEKIAEYLPSFDYVGRDEYGIRTDFPGSPYDRGKADASKHLSGVARAALSAMRGEP